MLKMRQCFMAVGLLLLIPTVMAVAQDDFPKVELTPEFEYIHVSPPSEAQATKALTALAGAALSNITSLN